MLTMWAVQGSSSPGGRRSTGQVARGCWKELSWLSLLDEGLVRGQQQAARWGGKGIMGEREVVEGRLELWDVSRVGTEG